MTPVQALVAEMVRLSGAITADEQRNSPGERERGAFVRAESIRSVDAQANLYLAAAADSLRSADLLVSARDIALGPFIAARASLEVASKTLFLLDPNIGPQERVGRSLNLRLRTVLEQQKIARRFDDAEAVESCSRRLDTITAVADELNLPIHRNRKGRVESIGAPMPSATDLAAVFVHSALYGILSGTVHGDTNTLQQMMIEEIGRGPAGEISVRPIVQHRLHADMLPTIAAVYARAAWLLLVREGASIQTLRPVFEERYDALRLKSDDSIRFWRGAH